MQKKIQKQKRPWPQLGVQGLPLPSTQLLQVLVPLSCPLFLFVHLVQGNAAKTFSFAESSCKKKSKNKKDRGLSLAFKASRSPPPNFYKSWYRFLVPFFFLFIWSKVTQPKHFLLLNLHAKKNPKTKKTVASAWRSRPPAPLHPTFTSPGTAFLSPFSFCSFGPR